MGDDENRFNVKITRPEEIHFRVKQQLDRKVRLTLDTEGINLFREDCRERGINPDTLPLTVFNPQEKTVWLTMADAARIFTMPPPEAEPEPGKVIELFPRKEPS